MKCICLAAALLAVFGCTENQRAKSFGGTQNIELKPNEILLNITWKDDDMWVLTRDTTTKIEYFRESSSWGIWNGEVVISEPGNKK